MKKAQIDSGCFSFILFRWKSTVIKLNCRTDFRADKREYSDNFRVLWARISVKETVKFFTVPMQVQNESDLTLFTDLVEKVFYTCDFRANRIFFARVPLSIQVFTCKIRPVMAINDTIDIYHWNNIKYVIFPQKITLFTFRKQFVNYAFTNKRPLSLAWMLSCHNNDSFPCIFFLH